MSAPPAKQADAGDLRRAHVVGTYEITVGDETQVVTVARLGPATCGQGLRYGVQIGDGPVLEVEATRPAPDVLSMLVEDAAWEAGLVSTDEGFDVEILGIRHEVEVIDPRRKALRLAEGAGGGAVKTAMPGRIVRVLVQQGAVVSKGDAVIVVEAMKMENELKAPRDGVVGRILVSPDQLVEAGTVLIELGALPD